LFERTIQKWEYEIIKQAAYRKLHTSEQIQTRRRKRQSAAAIAEQQAKGNLNSKISDNAAYQHHLAETDTESFSSNV